MSVVQPQVEARPARPRGTWLKKLGLALGTFLFCTVLLEVILRFYGYGNLEVYQPDASLYWKLKPNQDCFTKVDHKPVHINSHGTRGPEFSPAKPANTFRVISLGDSRTFGWGLSGPETYSELLQRSLNGTLSGGKRVEVINAGVNAWSYPQMLVYLREVALGFQPDAVIIGEANLWTQFSENNSPEFVKKFMTRVRLKNLLRRSAIYHFVVEVKLKDFYEKHRAKFIPVDPRTDQMFKEQQQKDPDAIFRRAIEQTCELALSNHVKPFLLFIPTADDLASTNRSEILRVKTEVSQALNVPLVDMTPDLRGAGKELYLEGDTVHLNARGNQLVAARLVEAISKSGTP